MVVATVGYGTSAGAGYGADSSFLPGMFRGDAFATGYAMLGIPSPPLGGVEPDTCRLEILDHNGVQLKNDFVDRTSLAFTVEHNGSGSVSFSGKLVDFPGGIDSTWLKESNLIRVHLGYLSAWPNGVAEGFITSAPPVKDDNGAWTISIQCPGSWDTLEYGVLWPPVGVVSDTREFSYTAGQTGPSYVPEQWGTPHGYLVKNSFRWKHRWPLGWPESASRWLWSSSPEKSSAPGERRFIGSFTLTGRHPVHFYAAGDETLKLYLNGALIKKKGALGWHRTASFIRTLPAGTYVVAASVSNAAGGDNRSGFIFACAQIRANGSRDHWLLRSSTSTFKIRTAAGYFAQVPLPPDGWYPAAVMWQHVSESAARGVFFYTSYVLTFSQTKDSSGSNWTTKGPVEYDIGTSGSSLGEMIQSLGVDMAMLPGLRLSAWKNRGFDLTGRVVISLPLAAQWSSRAWPRVRTVGLAHQESGWTESLGSAASRATYGRREMTLSAGGADGDAQADQLNQLALVAAGSPEETVEVKITSNDIRTGAPQPFRDFNVADTITVEMVGGYVFMKVMSISGDEQETKEMIWTIAGYPV